MLKNILKAHYKKQDSSHGFTLIELLVVIGIIAVLATLLMANFVGVRQRARDAQRKTDLRQIQAALELYRSDAGTYPSPDIYATACPTSGPLTSTSGSTVTTYMQRVPCDPLSAYPKYTYTYNATDGTYTLVACLENTNNSNEPNMPTDGAVGANPDTCPAAGRVSFTVTSP